MLNNLFLFEKSICYPNLHTYPCTLGIATYFAVKRWIRLSPMDWFQILWTWWAFQNLIKLAKFVAYEQNVIVYIFLLNFVMSFASGADHQASSAIVSKQSFNVKKIYTITFCSYATNFACFIKFWSAHHIHKRIWHQSIGERQIYITYDLFFAITILSTTSSTHKPGAFILLKMLKFRQKI